MAYKILSLDGGGSWAMIQARVLQDLYPEKTGLEILREFDLVIANSGGSMVLAAMVSDLKMSDIISVFTNENDRKEVFSKLSFWEKTWSKFTNIFGIGPKYSADRKVKGLEKVLMQRTKVTDRTKLLANQPMTKIPGMVGGEFPDLIVCGYNYFTERESFFRSNTHSNTDAFDPERWDVSLLHAIHASSNAPLNYFDEPAVIQTWVTPEKPEEPRRNAWYWDGAVGGFNNPVMAGLVEAMTNGKGNTAADYRILSIGTGAARKHVIVGFDEGNLAQKAIYKANKNSKLVLADKKFGFLRDLPKMAHSILADPPDAASFVAFSVLNPSLDNNNCIVRINPWIAPVLNEGTNVYEVPKAWKKGDEAFIDLLDLDMDAVEQEDILLIMDLCERFIVPNSGQPVMPNQFIRGNKDTKHIGYGTYAEAKLQWFA